METLLGFSEKKKAYIIWKKKKKKDREGNNTHAFNISFNKIENYVNC